MNPIQLLVLLGICAIWGLHFSVIKTSVDDVPPIFYAGVRMAAVAVLLAPWLRWHAGQMRKILLAALCFGSINYICLFTGTKLTSASVAAVLIEIYVPVATIFSVIFLKERIGLPRLFGIALALSGVLIIVTGGGASLNAPNLPLGAMFILAGVVFEATGAITIKRIVGVSPLQMLAWFGLIGSACSLGISAFVEDGQLDFLGTDQRVPALAALTYSTLLASIVGHTAYYWLLQRVDLSVLAGAGLMTTVLAVGFGVLLLGEPLTARFLIGCGVVLTGVAIIVVRSARRSKAPVIAPAGTDPPVIPTTVKPEPLHAE